MISKTAYLNGWMPYTTKRYITYGALTLISLLLPFLRIDGKHLFLLSFDKKQLHLLFTSFDMQELYLMPFLLIIFFLGIFFMTTLGGRVWCGWSCPQTIFRVLYRDLIQTKLLGLRKSFKNKQTEIAQGQLFKKTIAVILWTMLSFLAAANLMWYFIPPEDFILYIQTPTEHPVLMGFIFVIVAFLVYDIILLKEGFCIYVCPYARVQSVMYDDDTIQTIYNPNRGGIVYDEHGTKLWSKPPAESAECTGCEACVRICPTHIDIRKGMQLECINCLECSDACTKVMGALGKPSLITWTSPNEVIKGGKTNYVRIRTVAYGVALTIALALLMFMSTKKEYMLLNINRTTQLYKIQDGGKRVENAYTFLFQNTDNKDHMYYFKVDHPDVTIERPSEPFQLLAGKKIKKIVILSTTKPLANDERKDTPIPIVVTAFALDNQEKIIVNREAIFVYPRESVLKEHR